MGCFGYEELQESGWGFASVCMLLILVSLDLIFSLDQDVDTSYS